MQAQTGKHKLGIGNSGGHKPWRVSAHLLPSLLPELLYSLLPTLLVMSLPQWLSRSRQAIKLLPGLGLLAAMSWLLPASAAEFGEASVTSYIGQPLVAEVEVLALSMEEQGALQVKPAALDVYRGASIKFNPALSGLRWVVQRRGQRQFIRLSTERPVNTPFLNLFLELGVKNDMSVRALTLWLEANPDAVAKAEALQQERMAREDSAVQPPAEEAADVAAPVAESPLPSHATRICRGADHCAAVDRENRRIARQITELEKNVDGLRRVLVGAAGAPASVKTETPSRQANVPETAEPVAETAAETASAETELFLKQEEPIVPKKPVAKPTTPWKLIAMIAAGVLALLLAGLLIYKRSRRNKKTGSKNKPEKQPSWWARLQEKWRKRKAAKQPVVDAANAGDDASGDGTPEEEPQPDEPAPADGKKSGRASAMLASLKLRWQGMGTRLKQVLARGKKKPVSESTPVVDAGD